MAAHMGVITRPSPSQRRFVLIISENTFYCILFLLEQYLLSCPRVFDLHYTGALDLRCSVFLVGSIGSVNTSVGKPSLHLWFHWDLSAKHSEFPPFPKITSQFPSSKSLMNENGPLKEGQLTDYCLKRQEDHRWRHGSHRPPSLKSWHSSSTDQRGVLFSDIHFRLSCQRALVLTACRGEIASNTGQLAKVVGRTRSKDKLRVRKSCPGKRRHHPCPEQTPYPGRNPQKGRWGASTCRSLILHRLVWQPLLTQSIFS